MRNGGGGGAMYVQMMMSRRYCRAGVTNAGSQPLVASAWGPTGPSTAPSL